MADEEVVVKLSLIDEMSSEIKAIRANMETNFGAANKKLAESKGAFASLGQEIKGSFVNAIKGAVLAYASFEVINKVTGFMKSARMEYKESVQMQAQLRTALGYTSTALNEQAVTLGRKLVVDNEEITAVQIKLANYVKNEEQVKRLTPAVLDLAAATGMDMVSAANMVARSIADDNGELGRFKIAVEGATGSAERIDSIIKGVNERMDGQSVAAAAAKDWIDELSLAWTNFQENIGKAFSKKSEADYVEILRVRVSKLYEELEIINKNVKFDPLGGNKQEQLRILEEIKEKSKIIGDFEAKEKEAKAKSEADAKLAAEKAAADELLKLKIKLWETETNGRSKILAVQMVQELDAYTGTEEGKLLIRKRYENLINALKPKKEDVEQQPFTETFPSREMYEENLKKQADDRDATLEAQLKADEERAMSAFNTANVIDSNNKRLAEMDKQRAFMSAQYSLGTMASIFAGQKKYIAAYKTFAIAQALMDTYAAANTALKSAPPPFNFIAAGVSVAAGLVNVSKIASQKFATGTAFAPGGMALINEQGGEYVNLPRGSQVYNNTQTRNMTTNASMNVTIMDSSGNVTETLRAQIRSGQGDQLVRDIQNRLARQI